MQGFPLPPGPPTGAEPSSIVSPNHPYYGTPQPTPGGPNTNNQRYHEEVLLRIFLTFRKQLKPFKTQGGKNSSDFLEKLKLFPEKLKILPI